MNATMNGEWVQIKKVILQAGQRVAGMPEDTKKTSYLLFTKGFLVGGSGNPGDEVQIRTLAGRLLIGELVQKGPAYQHSFGPSVVELLQVGEELKEHLKE